MTKTILSLRRVSQALFFAFLVYLVIHTAFPLDLKIPVDLYLRLDPFIGIITILTGKGIIYRMLPAFGVLLLVIIFGNFFCGWFCPMGATIDFSSGKRSGQRDSTTSRSEGSATGSSSSPWLRE